MSRMFDLVKSYTGPAFLKYVLNTNDLNPINFSKDRVEALSGLYRLITDFRTQNVQQGNKGDFDWIYLTEVNLKYFNSIRERIGGDINRKYDGECLYRSYLKNPFSKDLHYFEIMT